MIRPGRTARGAARRLGTVGKAYEAVSDVISETGEKDKETAERRNFRKTIANLQVYNRIVKP
jgi:hypothetical protein